MSILLLTVSTKSPNISKNDLPKSTWSFILFESEYLLSFPVIEQFEKLFLDSQDLSFIPL
jgi:hypothetical protein